LKRQRIELDRALQHSVKQSSLCLRVMEKTSHEDDLKLEVFGICDPSFDIRGRDE